MPYKMAPSHFKGKQPTSTTCPRTTMAELCQRVPAISFGDDVKVLVPVIEEEDFSIQPGNRE